MYKFLSLSAVIISIILLLYLKWIMVSSVISNNYELKEKLPMLESEQFVYFVEEKTEDEFENYIGYVNKEDYKRYLNKESFLLKIRHPFEEGESITINTKIIEFDLFNPPEGMLCKGRY